MVVQWYPPLPNARTATAESRVGSNPREAFYSSAGTQSVFPLWALPCSRVAAAPSQQRGNTHTPAPALLQPPRSNVGAHTHPPPALLQPPSQQRGSTHPLLPRCCSPALQQHGGGSSSSSSSSSSTVRAQFLIAARRADFAFRTAAATLPPLAPSLTPPPKNHHLEITSPYTLSHSRLHAHLKTFSLAFAHPRLHLRCSIFHKNFVLFCI